MDIWIHPTFSWACNYISMKGLRDWSRSGGSYGNNTLVMCCPAPGRPKNAAPPNRAPSSRMLRVAISHRSYIRQNLSLIPGHIYCLSGKKLKQGPNTVKICRMFFKCHGNQYAALSRTCHYNDVKIGAMASQIASLTIVSSTVYLGADQRTHRISASLAFVRGIHRWPVNSPHKGPVTRKCFHLMTSSCLTSISSQISDNIQYKMWGEIIHQDRLSKVDSGNTCRMLYHQH